MTVLITKPAINLREKLSELEREEGLKGIQILAADTATEAADLLELENYSFDINSGTIDGVVIGGTTPAEITGTTITATDGYFVGATEVIDSSGNVKKSPTLTIDGDGSGSATFTDLGNATLTLTVADDSHNHSFSSGNFTVNGGSLTVGSGTNSSSIYMTDADDSTRRLYTDSGRIGFLDTSLNWSAYSKDDGDWIVEGNLGVGTTAPAASLHLSNNGGKLRITQDTAGGTLNGIDFYSYTGVLNGGLLWNQATGEIRLNTTSGYFPTIYSNGSEVVRITTAGNVGIGTTSPASKLQIGSVGTTGYAVSNGLAFGDGTRAGALNVDSNGTTIYSSTNLIFAPGTSEKVRISTDGKVGIGTNAPADILEVVDSDTDAVDISLYNSFAYGSGGAHSSRLLLGKIESGTRQPMAMLSASPDTNDNSAAGYLSFSTRTSSALTERMRIASNGSVGVGTSSPNANYKLHVAGVSYLQSGVQIDSGFKVNFGNPNQFIRGTNDTSIEIATAGGTSLIVTNDKYVGIGTTSPSAKIDVYQTATATGPAARFYVNGQTIQNLNGFQIYNNQSGGFVDTTLVYGNTVNSYLAFGHHNGTSYAERMRIANNGYLGIGTASPSAKLDVAGDIEINSLFNINAESGSTTSTTQTVIASFTAATYSSGKFIIQATDSVSGEVHITELLVVHDGTNVSTTEYGVLHTGASPLADYAVDINSGNVRILATAASANSTTYKVTENLITA